MVLNRGFMNVVIVIPAYNEEIAIEATLKQFADNCPEHEIWVIDNNSKDRTQEIAKECFRKFNLKGGVLFEKRQGKAFAMRTAFHKLDADYYGMIDADATYPVPEFNKMLQLAISGNYDMVVGDRHSKGDYEKVMKRPFHNLGNGLVKNLINKLFRSNLSDIMSGYRVMSRTFVKNYPILCAGFEIETEMTIHALDKRFHLIEYPIPFTDRPEGSFSKLNTYRDGYRIIKTIFWVFKDYHPLRFFGFFAILFLFLGLLSGFVVINEFIQTRQILHLPLAILATGLMLFSLLFTIVGLVLDTVVRNQKFNFELNLLSQKK